MFDKEGCYCILFTLLAYMLLFPFTLLLYNVIEPYSGHG